MSGPVIPPKPTLPEKPRGSWLAVFLTLGLTFSCVIVLTFLTIGYFAPVLVVGGIMGGVIAFHYVVWGWWLQPVLKRVMEEEEGQA